MKKLEQVQTNSQGINTNITRTHCISQASAHLTSKTPSAKKHDTHIRCFHGKHFVTTGCHDFLLGTFGWIFCTSNINLFKYFMSLYNTAFGFLFWKMNTYQIIFYHPPCKVKWPKHIRLFGGDVSIQTNTQWKRNHRNHTSIFGVPVIITKEIPNNHRFDGAKTL